MSMAVATLPALSPAAYTAYLKTKITIQVQTAMVARDDELAKDNKPHQSASIKWALERGSAGIFASFGLGKTRIQCELAKVVQGRTGKPFLIICPLNIKYQFVDEDGPALGMRWQYVTSDAEVENADTPFLITNYERVRDGNITPAKHGLGGVSLDEASVIHDFGSKTTQTLKRLLKKIPYKFVATATPDPNEYKEIIYYADFLGVRDVGRILTKWFMRNPDKAGDLRLIPAHKEDFWLWVASWGLFLYTPSDLGYSDEGYKLPELRVHWHRIGVDQTRAFEQVDKYGQHRLLLDAASGVTEAAAETRATISDRLNKALEIIAEHPKENWLLWHHLEKERKAIEKALPDAVTVYGSQKIEIKEQRIRDFAHGRTQILSTKPSLAGSGCNFQHHCHKAIFMGPSFKFKDFLQAVMRIYRFLQTYDVDIHIIYTESQDNVVNAMQRKWRQYDARTEMMRNIIRKYGLSLSAMAADASRTIGVKRMETKEKLFTAVNNDCVLEVQGYEDNSFDMICTSIPFGNHYEYTETLEDFGHNETDEKFWEQMEFLTPQLLRVLKPGRVAAIHVKDRIVYSYQTKSGLMEVSPFSDQCTLAFIKHGWMYMGRRTIVTDVVRENNSSYRLGWTEATEGDMTKMGCGLSEYVLLFRKPPTDRKTSRADVPVRHSKEEYTLPQWQIDAHGLWLSNGIGPLTPAELYDYHGHVARMEEKERKHELSKRYMVDPPQSKYDWVWTDVDFMHSLNANQVRKNAEKHICPLPFDIVRRLINMYSNPGDVILDPFAGMFTVPYIAMELDRIGHGIELAVQYFTAGVKYCQAMQRQKQMPTLWDYLKLDQPDPVAEPR